VPGLATSERSMENEHLAVTIESNGTLTVTDKGTGQPYERLLTFEDTADIGDGWYHGVAVNDETYVSSAAHSAVALVHDGPMVTTFRVRTTMSVPEAFRFDEMVRADDRADLVIDSLISLRPGARHIEVETTVHNNALDHRLGVLLPSGAQTATYLADTPYDVVERPIALRSDNHLYRELEVETKPQRTWTAVADATRGLAVISEGLLETAVRDLPERPLALTLFRSTRTTVGTSGEPGGQLQGTLQFRYWIAPLDGVPASASDRANLFGLADRLGCGVRSAQLLSIDAEQLRGNGGLAPSRGLLSVQGPIVVTAVEMRGEGLEIRAFNPGTDEVEATFTLPSDIACQQVQPVNLESVPEGDPLPVEDGQATYLFPPKKIVTLRLQE
jgi:alpha-mannosidase